MTGILQQFGMKAESTYGTDVTVDRFYELSDESLQMGYGRTRSAGRRSGQRTHRTDRFLPFKDVLGGSISLDVPTKGFGVLLNAITGGTASVGSVTDSNYTQTHTIGTMLGKSYTLQVNRPDTGATSRVFTYGGCKVASAEFAIDVDGVLTCTVEWIGEDETTATALASVSYASDFRVFSFVNATMTVAGTTTPCKNWRLKITNPYETRRMVQGSALTLEPLENDLRTVEVSWTAEFTSLTDYNRAASATAAGALASVVMTCDGDVAHGGSTLPEIVFTTPKLDFTQASGPFQSANQIPMVDFTGTALYDGSSEPLTVTYRTTDSAI